MENTPSISNHPQYDISKFICPLHELNIVHYCKCADRKDFLLCEKCFDDANCPNYRHTFHDLGPFKRILRILFNNHPSPKLLENYLVNTTSTTIDDIQNQERIVLEEMKLLFDNVIQKMNTLSEEIINIFKSRKESIEIHKSQPNKLEKLLAGIIDKIDDESIKTQFSIEKIKQDSDKNSHEFEEKIGKFRKLFEENFFKNLDDLKNLLENKDFAFSNTQIEKIQPKEIIIDIKNNNSDIQKINNDTKSIDKIFDKTPITTVSNMQNLSIIKDAKSDKNTKKPIKPEHATKEKIIQIDELDDQVNKDSIKKVITPKDYNLDEMTTSDESYRVTDWLTEKRNGINTSEKKELCIINQASTSPEEILQTNFNPIGKFSM